MNRTTLSIIVAAILAAPFSAAVAAPQPVYCSSNNPISADRDCVAIGDEADATFRATAIGNAAKAMGQGSIAIGDNARAIDTDTTQPNMAIAIGTNSQATGFGGVALGSQAQTVGYGVAIGEQAVASAHFATSVGNAAVSAERSVAIGANANASHAGSVAIGNASRADGRGLDAGAFLTGETATSEVSFSAGQGSRRLRGVAAGALDTDAVNVGQLRTMGQGIANWLGGGAGMVGGVFQAPTFTIQGAGYSNVAAAFAAVDTSLTNIRTEIAGIESGAPGTPGRDGIDGAPGRDGIDGAPGRDGIDGRNGADGRDGIDGTNGRDGAAGPQGPKGDQGEPGRDGIDGRNGADGRDGTNGRDGATGPQGPKGDQGDQGEPGEGGGGRALAVEYTDETRTSVTLNPDGDGEARISNVAEGQAETDAVNVSQLRAQSVGTTAVANSYTDQRVTELSAALDGFRQNVDDRFQAVDTRFDRAGAISSASAQMAINTAGLGGVNRVGVGAGFQGGRSALAIGYQRIVSPNASVSIGGAVSGSERTMGVGAGFSW